jgi:protein SCO1
MSGVAARRWGCLMTHLRVPALLAVIVVSGALVSTARADGDPASDYLVGRQVFLTSLTNAESSQQQELIAVVQAANRAGFAIRVATIATEYDLGSITELWRNPRVYVRFLGLELGSVYKQRLLVVMPNGFGFYWPGHPTASAYRLLVGVRIAPGDRTLASAAQAAVRKLAGADGVSLPAATGSSTGARATAKSGRSSVAAVSIAAIAVFAGAVVAMIAVRRRRRRCPQQPRRPSVATGAAPPRRLRWAVPGFAALVILATGTPIALLIALRHPGTSGESVDSVISPPAFSWPAGRRPAPNFVLRDQNGHRASMAQFRGRPVIVTFVDPLCRNLCPLEAHLLNQVVGEMPVSRRPVILAVSVDVYADTRADLLQDEHKWELVPQWHWAVGPPAQLAAVWKRYEIGVSVVTKRIAGTTINYITHTEAAYVIDATGHERALFVWPFYPQDVEHTLRQLT